MASSATAAAKQQLRTFMKQRLASIPQESVNAQSRQVYETLQNLKPYKDASRISIYLSMPAAEIQTDAIVRHALAAGKHVFVPYLHRNSLEMPGTPAWVMDMVKLEDVQDYESLVLDRWGIPSVDPSTAYTRQHILGGPDAHHPDAATLDLVLMPGVAFDIDHAGSVRRLGHGKGFYDFFLNRYVAKADATHILEKRPLLLYGLALTEQFITAADRHAVPTGQYDRGLHGLILGNGEVRLGPHSPIDQ